MSFVPPTMNGAAGPVHITRDPAGVLYVTAVDLADALLGLGFCHARDRSLQMLLVRLLGRGQASEHLQASPELLRYDQLFRRLCFARDADAELAILPSPIRTLAQAYVRGVNACWARGRLPWELRLLGYQPSPWTVADIFLTAKVAGYVGLAQTQGQMERFLVQCVQQGLRREQLEELFPGQLAGLDEELLKKVRLPRGWGMDPIPAAAPQFSASNNWVVAGAKTDSGAPFLCNDPHVEANRLPPLWHEVVLRWQDAGRPRYAMGATMPGVPGIVIGRTPDLAWGITYAFMDCLDSWVEECRNGQFRYGQTWRPFKVRHEVVRRRKQPPVELRFYENEHGVLEGNPWIAGFYLATRWSSADGTSASSLTAVLSLLNALTVEEGRRVLGRLNNSSWNWVLADQAGDIGYQMSGCLPRRVPGASGLVPLPGWDPANDWRGFFPPEDLPRCLNPPAGFVATANHDLNHLGQVKPINLAMAAYRAERIRAVLGQPGRRSLEEMKRLQLDLHSRQAEQFLALLKPLLPDFAAQYPAAVASLLGWDGEYRHDSPAPSVFEQVYAALNYEVFAQPHALGPSLFRHLWERTSLFTAFGGHFDRILLAEKSLWFGDRSREAIYRQALAKGLAAPLEPYGRTRRIRLEHLLLGRRLPRWLGFDRFIRLPGSRATVHQGQILRASDRHVAVGPTYRFVTDLARDQLHTALLGGNSDRRFSRYYANQIRAWLAGGYKAVSGWPEAS